jgi:hypothetical protein
LPEAIATPLAAGGAPLASAGAPGVGSILSGAGLPSAAPAAAAGGGGGFLSSVLGTPAKTGAPGHGFLGGLQHALTGAPVEGGGPGSFLGQVVGTVGNARQGPFSLGAQIERGLLGPQGGPLTAMMSSPYMRLIAPMTGQGGLYVPPQRAPAMQLPTPDITPQGVAALGGLMKPPWQQGR